MMCVMLRAVFGLWRVEKCSCEEYPYQWNPDSSHPCNIVRMDEHEFTKRFGLAGLPPLYPYPIVITSTWSTPDVDDSSSQQQQQQQQQQQDSNTKRRNQDFQFLTQHDQILRQFPNEFQVTLSSSNSFSEHRRTIPFHQYLDEVMFGPALMPNQLSNETWYLFGETYSEEWKVLLDNYELPNCEACRIPDFVALSFGIGNRGSGVQWHVHGPGFSESIHGRKHWILSQDKPDFHPDQTSLNWMEYTYTSLARAKAEETPAPPSYYECTLDPGDIIYFPDMWWHATINLDTYTAFVSTFTQEHKLVPLSADATDGADDSDPSRWEDL